VQPDQKYRGIDVEVNIDKKTFWNQKSGELIRRPFLDYFERHGLRKGLDGKSP